MLTPTAFLHYERFHFEPSYRPGLNWPAIVALVLNFGTWAVALIIAWRLIHG